MQPGAGTPFYPAEQVWPYNQRSDSIELKDKQHHQKLVRMDPFGKRVNLKWLLGTFALVDAAPIVVCPTSGLT